MNEFTIWDKVNLHWIDLFGISISDSGEVMAVSDLNGNQYGLHQVDLINYIGKTDIEGNKIYADSSIVEFDYIYIETIGKQSDKARVKGYFTFNNDTLAYDLIFFHNWIDSMPNYWFNMHMKKEDARRASNFKIIDTLQENPKLLKGD